MLQLAEQAFLVFLEDEEEAFNVITQHAARKRALRDEASNSKSGGSSKAGTSESSSCKPHPQPAVVFTPDHTDIIKRMESAMSQLPGGEAGRRLFAIALNGIMSATACVADCITSVACCEMTTCSNPVHQGFSLASPGMLASMPRLLSGS